MTRDQLDDLWEAIDRIPDAPPLEHMSGDDVVRLGVELDQAAVALRNAADLFAENARCLLDPERWEVTS